MREESHLDDMRAAIRGDFERLEERRGEQELLRPAPERKVPTEASPEFEPEDGPEQAEEPIEEVTVASAQGPSDDVPDERPGSWLDRLLGR